MSKENIDKLNSLSDQEKIDYIDSNRDLTNSEKRQVIASISDDDKKIDVFKKYSSELNLFDKTIIIKSFSKDFIKLEYLKTFKSEFETYTKSQILTEFDDEFSTMEKKNISEIFKDKVVLSASLGGINNQLFSKEVRDIIVGLKNEKSKFDLMFLYKDDLLKSHTIDILNSIEDDQIKIDYLTNSQIEINDRDRLVMISTFKEPKSFERLGIALDDSYSTILNLPLDLTFGVEIESEGEKANEFAMLKKILNGWKTKDDITLINGVEVVSPILHDTETDISSIGQVCTLMKEFGLYTTERCGGHIHFGADFLGQDVKAWETFFTIYNECEEIFYKMSNEEGDVPRNQVLNFAEPSNAVFNYAFQSGDIKIENQRHFNRVLYKLQDSRDRGLNLINLSESGKNTIEFRMPNGNLKSEIVKENIKLFGNLLDVSKKIAEGSKDKEDIFERLKDRELSEADKVEVLLELLFDKEEERNIYRKRWDSIKDNEIFDKLKAYDLTFKRGDYSMKKEIKPLIEETRVKDRVDFGEELKNEVMKSPHNNKKGDFERE